MKEILTYIVENILPEVPVEIKEQEEDGFIIFTLVVPQDQMGKIIGKNGKTINSIKNLLKIRAIKEEKRIDIQVQEK